MNKRVWRNPLLFGRTFNYLAEVLFCKRRNMRDKKKHNLKIYGQSGYKYKETPTIILKGQWLKDAGFEIGDHITLECDKGSIVIKVDEKRSNGDK